MRGLIFGYRFRVTARWRGGVVTEREVRARGLTMRRAWERLLRTPSHPEVEMRAIGPI
jgi:hypothetical protein